MMNCSGSWRSTFDKPPASDMPFKRRRLRFPRYVPVAERQQVAVRARLTLAEKGHALAPIVVEGRGIATTFWGKAWCENLERYSDFANRLGRGRTYLRSGLVLDLQIAPGVVTARVSGTDLYMVEITVTAVPKRRWRAICSDVAGTIDSVIELLQGQLSQSVMARLCAKGTGLFPAPSEIRMRCSCPDAAVMCKHVAAVLYGVGARLDREPALLFTLRRVKQEDLVSRAGSGAALTRRRPTHSQRKTLDESALADVFGLDIAPKAGGKKSRTGR
jgi:uncharacterized Zn finger protein